MENYVCFIVWGEAWGRAVVDCDIKSSVLDLLSLITVQNSGESLE